MGPGPIWIRAWRLGTMGPWAHGLMAWGHGPWAHVLWALWALGAVYGGAWALYMGGVVSVLRFYCGFCGHIAAVVVFLFCHHGALHCDRGCCRMLARVPDIDKAGIGPPNIKVPGDPI